MPDNMTLRPALHGFNRRDVLSCIEQLNNSHKTQLQALEAQLQELREENSRLRAALDAAAQEKPMPTCQDSAELEAYRRAERAEREARERAARICAQTDAVLADVAQTVNSATAQMSLLMQSWADAAENTRTALQSATEAIHTICPED